MFRAVIENPILPNWAKTLRRFRTHLLCIIQNRCDFASYSEHLSKLLRIEEVINFEYKLSMSPVQLKEWFRMTYGSMMYL